MHGADDRQGACGFLSTPSARRATAKQLFIFGRLAISIHALREEGDRASDRRCAAFFNFYPRPPRGGRPSIFRIDQTVLPISIHALREEGDGRRSVCLAVFVQFLSTPSARRATGPGAGQGKNRTISIHALREEGDERSAPHDST